MKNKIFIHYGSNYFDYTIFKKIRNRDGWVKPYGGFWASSSSYNFSWKNWLEVEEYWNSDDINFGKYKDSFFEFRLNSDKILTIKTDEELDEIMKNYANKEGLIYPITKCLDFEKLAKDYDAIEVIISNDYRLNRSLMSWDCDSILIFNPNIIEVIEDEVMAL